MKRYPTGASAEVYYDSMQPTKSVLRRGLEPEDFLTLIALLPFNFAAFLGASLLVPIDRFPGGPYSVFRGRQDLNVNYRIYRWLPLQSACIASGVVTFLLVFVTVGLVFLNSVWIVTWLTLPLIGLASLTGVSFAKPTILEVDLVHNRLIVESGDHRNELELQDKMEFKKKEKQLVIQSCESGDLLPEIEFYSNEARDWISDQLQTVIGKRS